MNAPGWNGAPGERSTDEPWPSPGDPREQRVKPPSQNPAQALREALDTGRARLDELQIHRDGYCGNCGAKIRREGE